MHYFCQIKVAENNKVKHAKDKKKKNWVSLDIKYNIVIKIKFSDLKLKKMTKIPFLLFFFY